jgi:cytosine/adenosine deaminase-related metal-dependent hydrolase
LASNHQLSILNELKLIQSKHPQIGLSELLTMATLNGAKALGLEDSIGSFKPGKKPGILLLNGSGIKNGSLTADSKVQRII